MSLLNLKKIIKEEIENLNQIQLNNNFWKWFGSSKVMKDNKPQIVYHGTNKNFKSFDTEKIGYGTGNYGHYGYGFYFSSDIREARVYGNNILECYIKIEKPFTGTDEQMLMLKRKGAQNIDEQIIQSIDYDSLYNEIKKIDENAALLMEYVKSFGIEKAWEKFMDEKREVKDYYNDISNYTAEYTTLNKRSEEVPNYVFQFLYKLGVKITNLKLNWGFMYDQSLHWITDLGNLSHEITDIIKSLGFDGVIYGSEYVIFESNDIKSIKNDGTWDINDNDIFS